MLSLDSKPSAFFHVKKKNIVSWHLWSSLTYLMTCEETRVHAHDVVHVCQMNVCKKRLVSLLKLIFHDIYMHVAKFYLTDKYIKSTHIQLVKHHWITASEERPLHIKCTKHQYFEYFSSLINEIGLCLFQFCGLSYSVILRPPLYNETFLYSEVGRIFHIIMELLPINSSIFAEMLQRGLETVWGQETEGHITNYQEDGK